MRLAASLALATALFLPAAAPAAAMKKVPYPEVKVKPLAPFKSDSALDAMRKSLAGAVGRKDASALFALVGPDFFWTADGSPAEQYDSSLDALTNFKVAFGFRAHGENKDSDGAAAFWGVLDDAVSDPSLAAADDEPGIACGPVTAEVIDEGVRDRAQQEIADKDEDVVWVYTLKEIALTEKSTGGDTVSTVSNVALPVFSRYPAPKAGAELPASFYEVLLPSGKTGWIDADGVDPLGIDRLCYGKDEAGAWKIVGYEQNS